MKKYLLCSLLLSLPSIAMSQSKWGFNTPSKAMIEYQVRQESSEENRDVIENAFTRKKFQMLLKESVRFINNDSIHAGLQKVNEAFELGYDSPEAYFLRGVCLVSLEFYDEGLSDLRKAAVSGDKYFYDTYIQTKNWLKENGDRAEN